MNSLRLHHVPKISARGVSLAPSTHTHEEHILIHRQAMCPYELASVKRERIDCNCSGLLTKLYIIK